jgi:hypothetical protein
MDGEEKTSDNYHNGVSTWMPGAQIVAKASQKPRLRPIAQDRKQNERKGDRLQEHELGQVILLSSLLRCDEVRAVPLLAIGETAGHSNPKSTSQEHNKRQKPLVSVSAPRAVP